MEQLNVDHKGIPAEEVRVIKFDLEFINEVLIDSQGRVPKQ